jgi:translation initiation factor IF-1
MSKEDIIQFNGIIAEVMPNQTFKVKLANDHLILCYTSGKMKKNKIRLVQGDAVIVEMTPYDLSRGRITYRS